MSNNKLRKLLTKGPKYREPVPLDFQKARVEILKGVDQIIQKWSGQNSAATTLFKSWKMDIIALLDERIQNIQTNIENKEFTPHLQNRHIKNALKNLHENFVLTPVDKASSNIAIICKRFYAKVLIEELGLKNQTTNTYEHITSMDEENISETHMRDLKSIFNMQLPEDMQILSKLYWIPKIHKKTIKFRFIVAGVKCSVKPLAKSVTSVLKKFYGQIENYYAKSHFFSGIKNFWCVQNKDPITKNIDSLNSRGRANSVTTYDFSTLYTKIPHGNLIEVLNELIDFCWKGRHKRNIIITKNGAFWPKEETGNTKKNNDNVSFSWEKFKKAISFLMDNCYFKMGSKIFRQVIGIPMGSDPAPFMANLYLFHYENIFMRNLKKEDIQKARRFGNVFRFIDDLCAINDNGLFEEYYKDIYPKDLILTKENQGNKHASFLDLDITILDKKFNLKLYDKRDAFSFSIVRMPHITNNMPSKIFYSTTGSEILRIATCTTDASQFVTTCKNLLTRMFNQGARYMKTKTTLNKFFNKNKYVFSKFFENSESMCKDIIPTNIQHDLASL